jgi:hypothetical protein
MYSDKSTMIDSFELKGTWWLPENPDDKLAGFLTYECGDIELKLLGQFGSCPGSIKNYEPGKFQPEIMCGQCDGKLVTLSDLILVSNGFHGGVAADYSSRYIAERLIVGWAFGSKNELWFSNSDAKYANLEHWVGQRPFDDNGLCNDGYSLSYETPSMITAYVRQLDAEISVVGVYSVHQGFSERNIVHRNVVRIRPVSQKSLDWFLKSISTFRNLLAFANCDQVNTEVIELYFSGVPTSHPDGISKVSVYFKQLGEAKPGANREFPRFLFSFESICHQFEKVVNSWYEKSDELSTVHDLLFGTMYNRRLYMRFQFLSLVHAVESYDRIRNKTQYLTEQEYERIRSTLVAAIPQSVASDHRESLKNRIRYGNEASLRKRMTEIFKSLSVDSVNLVTDDAKKFVKRIVDTRNYFTHYGNDSKENSMDEDSELYEFSLRLKILLYILLLKEIGISEDFIVNAIRSFPKLNYINDR